MYDKGLLQGYCHLFRNHSIEAIKRQVAGVCNNYFNAVILKSQGTIA